MFCRNCGKELTGAREICVNCGAKPMAGTGFCPGCGAPTTPLTETCGNCGVQVTKATKERTWKLTAAGIICIITGTICVISGISLPLLIIVGIIAIVGGIYALRRRTWGLALAGSICALFSGFVYLGSLVILAFFLSLYEPSVSRPTIVEIFANIWSDWNLRGVIFGFTILGILAIIFVIKRKGEFE